MKKLVTLVMIAASTTFAMTSCGGGDLAEALENAAEEMEAAAEEMEAAIEEEVVTEEIVEEVEPAMDDTTAAEEVVEEEIEVSE